MTRQLKKAPSIKHIFYCIFSVLWLQLVHFLVPTSVEGWGWGGNDITWHNPNNLSKDKNYNKNLRTGINTYISHD